MQDMMRAEARKFKEVSRGGVYRHRRSFRRIRQVFAVLIAENRNGRTPDTKSK